LFQGNNWMPQTRDTPTFNMKAVVRETGLKPDTLRAWERRYNLPQPERTAGGHRLYSQRDIETLQWLMAQQAEGLSISRAVKLWYRLATEGHDPLQIIPAPGVIDSVVTRPIAVGGETIDNLREEWLMSCQAFDESSAERILTEALALFPAETVCIEILQKGLAQIGEGWYEDKITVQQEHFTSAQAVRRIEALLAATATPVRPGRILVVCAPGEQHTFGLLLLTLLLRRRGWEAIYLGANVPADQLENALEATNPNLVIASAQLLHTAASLLDLADLLSVEEIPLAYGGRIFNTLPELQERIPGHFLGPNLKVLSGRCYKCRVFIFPKWPAPGDTCPAIF
jgi:methanogenic corrinoid protein MtbC1